MTLIVNADNFDETVKEWITLLDFWAEWCGPCKMMESIIDQFAEKARNNVKVWKVNVDENSELAQRFRIMSIPAILIFKNWELLETLVGVQDIAKLEEVSWKYL
jgi:thioredoxin 1